MFEKRPWQKRPSCKNEILHADLPDLFDRIKFYINLVHCIFSPCQSDERTMKMYFSSEVLCSTENSKSFVVTLSQKEYNDTRAAVDDHRGVYLL